MSESIAFYVNYVIQLEVMICNFISRVSFVHFCGRKHRIKYTHTHKTKQVYCTVGDDDNDNDDDDGSSSIDCC